MFPRPVAFPFGVNTETMIRSVSVLFLVLGPFAVEIACAAPAEREGAEAHGDEPTIVVTASRIATPLGRVSSAVTVITREDIERRHPASMTDLLRQVPGLHIDQVGGRGGISSVYLRGGDPNFVMVLIDGIQVNDPTNSRGGSYSFSDLDVESVERVEILRGPASSVYGSNALGGVINIMTRSGTDHRGVAAHAGAGGHGERRGGGRVSGPLGDLGTYHVEGALLNAGTPVPGHELRGGNFNARVDLVPSTTTGLSLSSRYASTDATSFPDDSGGAEFAVLRDVDRRESEERGFGAEAEHTVSAGTAFQLQAQYFQREEHGTSPGVAAGVRDPFGIPPNGGDTRLQRYNVVASGLFEVSQSVRLTIGLASERERGAGDGFLELGGTPAPTSFALSRSTRAAFLEAQHASRDGWTLHGGLRLDDPEGFSPEISPRLGIRYPIGGDGIAIKANWAQGFKLPSIFALRNPIVGNPALQPETSTSLDIGVSAEWWDRRAQASATLFHNRFLNVIDLAEGPPPRLVNRSEVTARGVEVEGGVRLPPDVGVQAHVTYTQTDIEGTTEALRNRPKWRAGIDAHSRIKKIWTVSGALLYVGKVLDSSIPTGNVDLAGYMRVDLAATWTPSSTWQVSLGVDNVLDAQYEEAVGFPATGRTPRMLMRTHF